MENIPPTATQFELDIKAVARANSCGITFSLQTLMEKKNKPIIPGQHTGKAIEAKRSVSLNNDIEAQIFYAVVKDRLLDVNRWSQLSGDLSAEFQLVNPEGIAVNRKARKGDYFKIDIPGPGSITGGGYDWVRIEEIETASSAKGDSYAFRVRPSQNPLNNGNDIAHFYSPQSTSTFIVRRIGNMVSAAIYDRNTRPNENADLTLDKFRDAMVGTAGVIAFSKIQWTKLIDGLLQRT